jgi:hypothetical protein
VFRLEKKGSSDFFKLIKFRPIEFDVAYQTDEGFTVFITQDQALSDHPIYYDFRKTDNSERTRILVPYFWKYTRHSVSPPSGPPASVALGVPAIPAKALRPQEKQTVAEPVPKFASPPSAAANQRPASDIRLAVKRENGYLLITCAPAAEGGVLEEANLNSSPLEWRPLLEDTNWSNRWYVPPNDGARAFRLKIP